MTSTFGRSLVAAAVVCAPSIVAAQQRDTLGAHAQTSAVFRGRVVHASDGVAVGNADVWLPSVDRHVSTDSSGAFRFEGLPAGTQLVQVRRVGLDVERDTIVLSTEHENVRTYALADQSTELDTVRTTAGSQKYRSPMLRAFEERRLSKQGGQFISDSVLRQNESTSFANLISSRVPGLMQRTVTIPRKGVFTTLVSTRKQCSGLVILDSCKGVPNCYVAVYVDGVERFSTKMGSDPPDFAHDFNVSEFAGVEYYPGGAASPSAMHSDDDGCGSLWLWTRER